jgi:prolyl-tRNA editing enzyme YbaK/EbsC (Cys-tRNA(Pro) deacylase)
VSDPSRAQAVPTVGTLPARPAAEVVVRDPDLLGPAVAAALAQWPHIARVAVTPIDPALAETTALARAHHVPLDASANCVVVAGRRQGQERVAACVVLATTRADVNGAVRRLLDVRKASFLSMERAVAETGMAYGGITPVGLPASWRLLVDSRVTERDLVVIGSGVRHSKLVLPGADLGALPAAEVVAGLALPA